MNILVRNYKGETITRIETPVVPRRDEFICVPGTNEEGVRGERFYQVKNVYYRSNPRNPLGTDVTIETGGTFFKEEVLGG